MKNAFFKNLIKFNDIYFISEIIKEENKNYELFYNKLSKQYVIIDNSKKQTCITFNHYPDHRVLDKLDKTKIENARKLFKEIELNNQKIEQEKFATMQDLATSQLEEIISFASKTTCDLSKQQIKKIINTGVDYD